MISEIKIFYQSWNHFWLFWESFFTILGVQKLLFSSFSKLLLNCLGIIFCLKGHVRNNICSYFVSVRQGGRGWAAFWKLSQKLKNELMFQIEFFFSILILIANYFNDRDSMYLMYHAIMYPSLIISSFRFNGVTFIEVSDVDIQLRVNT